MSPKVSVIIPVYNTEKYLAEALDSICRQTLGDIELIAVDDGSTDGSSNILSSYKQQMGGRMTIVTKANAGQASARNDALGIASGEFVYFMDSDDWIESGTLERCVRECEEDNLDFVFFDGVSSRDDGSIDAAKDKWLDYHRGGEYPDVQTGSSVMLDMLKKGIYKCTVCMSLFRRKFLDDNTLRFQDGMKRYEDEIFSAKAYSCAQRIKGIPFEFYHRRVRENSTMTAQFGKRNVDGYLEVAAEINAFFKGREDNGIRRELISTFMLSLMHNGWKLPVKEKTGIAEAVLIKYPWTFRLKPFAAFLFKKFLRP